VGERVEPRRDARILTKPFKMLVQMVPPLVDQVRPDRPADEQADSEADEP